MTPKNRRYAFPVSGEGDAELTIPVPMTPEGYDLFRANLNSFLDLAKPALTAPDNVRLREVAERVANLAVRIKDDGSGNPAWFVDEVTMKALQEAVK